MGVGLMAAELIRDGECITLVIALSPSFLHICLRRSEKIFAAEEEIRPLMVLW